MMNSLTSCMARGCFTRLFHKAVTTSFVSAEISRGRICIRNVCYLHHKCQSSHVDSPLSMGRRIHCKNPVLKRLKVRLSGSQQGLMSTLDSPMSAQGEFYYESEDLCEQGTNDIIPHTERVHLKNGHLHKPWGKHKNPFCHHVLNFGTDCHTCSHNGCYVDVRGYHMSTRCGAHVESEEARLFPITALQRFSAIPIVPEDKMVFHPSPAQLAEGTRLFTPTKQHSIMHRKSVVDLEKLPEYDIPEVCFVGRSNVGKSSLIRAMFSEAPELQERVTVSKKPGHTKTLKFYQVGSLFTLVDMPGYGYNMPAHYVESVEGYLKTRKKVVRCFVLIDASSGVTAADRVGLSMMEEFVIPYVIVFTKIDKVARHQLLKNLTSVLQYRDDHTDFCLPQPFLVSSMTGDGLTLLQTFIAYVTGSLNVT